MQVGKNRKTIMPIGGPREVFLSYFGRKLVETKDWIVQKIGNKAQIVENGAQKLSTGLVTIVQESKHPAKQKDEKKSNSSYKALFIADPDRTNADAAELNANHITNKTFYGKHLQNNPSQSTSLLKSSQPTRT